MGAAYTFIVYGKVNKLKKLHFLGLFGTVTPTYGNHIKCKKGSPRIKAQARIQHPTPRCSERRHKADKEARGGREQE